LGISSELAKLFTDFHWLFENIFWGFQRTFVNFV